MWDLEALPAGLSGTPPKAQWFCVTTYGDWFGRNLTLDPVMIAKVVNATLQSDFDYVADHTLPAC